MFLILKIDDVIAHTVIIIVNINVIFLELINIATIGNAKNMYAT